MGTTWAVDCVRAHLLSICCGFQSSRSKYDETCPPSRSPRCILRPHMNDWEYRQRQLFSPCHVCNERRYRTFHIVKVTPRIVGCFTWRVTVGHVVWGITHGLVHHIVHVW